ncbi:MAG: AI-2E family transporter [Patescibacteria group bacterium]
MKQLYTVEISLTTLIKTLAFAVALGIVWVLRDVLLSAFLAVMLAGVLYPFVKWAEKKRIPKALAVGSLLFLALALIIAIVAFLVPAMVEQASHAIEALGSSVSSSQSALGQYGEIFQRLGITSETATSLLPELQKVTGQLLSRVNNVFDALTGAIIIIALSFYTLLEEDAAKKIFKNVIPEKYQEFAARAVWQVVDRLGSWLRGQLTLSLVITICYFTGFSFIGLPYALLLAIIGGLLEFLPYVGPIMAAIPVAFFAFGMSPLTLVIALTFMLVIHQLENHVLAPLIMRRAVGLSPVISILAFLTGAKLFGIAGALFAIPVATAVSVAYAEYVQAFPTRTS